MLAARREYVETLAELNSAVAQLERWTASFAAGEARP